MPTRSLSDYASSLMQATLPEYSPMATALMQATSSQPNPMAEAVFSPFEYGLKALGVPEVINTGIKPTWTTPATYAVNAAAKRKLLALLGDYAAGMALAKAVPAARMMKSVFETGMTPNEYQLALAARQQDFSNALAATRAELAARTYVPPARINLSDLMRERARVVAQTRPPDAGYNLWGRDLTGE